MALLAVGRLIGIGAEFVAKIKAEWVSPESWVDDGDVFFGDGFGVVFVLFVKAFFESVIHSVDGGFSIFVAFESVEIGFLDEKENKKERGENCHDDKF